MQAFCTALQSSWHAVVASPVGVYLGNIFQAVLPCLKP